MRNRTTLLPNIERNTHPRALLRHNWRNVELPQTQMRRIDLLADLENGTLFHLELQTKNDLRIGRRLLQYGLLIEDALDQVPEQMVLYIGWERLRMPASFVRPNLRYDYQMVDIRDLDPGLLRGSDRIEDRILSILVGHGDAKPLALEVLHEISEMEAPARGAALAKLLVTSGLRRLPADLKNEVRHMPLLSDVLENPFLKDWFEEGEAKGRTEEARRLTLLLLSHKFGPLPDWAIDKVVVASRDRLEAALDQILEAQTLERALDFPNPGPPEPTT
jgi:hypothetical protein